MAFVKLTNRAAHIKHIQLGGGESIVLPPTERDTPVAVELGNPVRAERIQRALTTQGVLDWVANGELVIEFDGEPPAAAATAATAPTEPPAAEPEVVTDLEEPPAAPPEPAPTYVGRRGRKKESSED